MGINYLENQYLHNSLFTNEECLEINYLPHKILHREQELIMLSKIFIKLIETPFLISRKVLIQGAIGIGKTLITKKFGEMLLKSANKREIPLYYIHINCRIEKTNYKIVHRILTELNYPVPKRGFSPQELISILHEYLVKKKIYILVVLDELNYLQANDFDLIYSLTRLNEIDKNQKNYLSLITIVRDITLLGNLDKSTLSTLQGNILSLKRYKIDQITNILRQRVELSTKENCFSEALIKIISENVVNSGDIRKGLTIIRNSIKIAETMEHPKVTIEDVNQAMKNLIPSVQDNALDILNMHQIFLLMAIIQNISENEAKETELKEIKEKYQMICINSHKNPRKHTQIWQNLQILKNYNLIHVENRSKEIKGRKSFITINNMPLSLLEEKLQLKFSRI